MNELHHIFVYGTLLRDERNHHLIERAMFIGPARTARGFRLHDLGHFPGMIVAGRGHVHGELFAIDDATLARVDRLEGHPHFYRRTAVRLDDGRAVETYLLRADQVIRHPAIPGGDWRRRSRSARQGR